MREKRKCGIGLLAISILLISTLVWAQGWQTIKDPVKIFQEGYIQVVGISEEGQSRYRAIRAAEVVAQRELLEILQGLHLYGETTVRDGMLASDVIRTRVEGFLRGAVKCGEKYYPDRGYAEVCMRLYIRGRGGMYDIILPLLKEEGLTPPSLPEYKPRLIPKEISPKVPEVPESKIEKEEKPEVAAPSELKEVHDGLIVDVREYAFKPALVNRIITDKNEVVFDPSKIVSNILVERGCGGFTTDLSKAKALLTSWGAKNPMIVKAVGVYKSTDAKISSDAAAAIYVHDQRANFLAEAKVVFVLK
ncbi:hypothetical protein [Thermosulfurimonas dismutans]|uniref:Putative lipoprotein required for motility n=1 Tax=Thermosulfurimonas dismutans TaxID=999894 RepID=A0A179D5Q2_9BACT|nr:hypothetical protein [Thermosulfurimonas dismutans]OAQ20928.1 putative lipoprotein required for motility [Thermosulfurimonas dismutans]